MRTLSFPTESSEIQTYVTILQQIIQTTPQAAAITSGMREVRAGALSAGWPHVGIGPAAPKAGAQRPRGIRLDCLGPQPNLSIHIEVYSSLSVCK